MRKIRFIVNPFSGVSEKSNLEQLVSDELDAAKFEFEVFYTQAPKHATELCTSALKSDIDIIAVVGGDGTVNEVAKAMLHQTKSLVILPGGSGNGFAMHLGMGRDLRKAIALINDSEEVTIDSGSANGEFFINVAGLGFDGRICNVIQNESKRGIQVYFKSMFREAHKFPFLKATIEIDGQKIEDEFISITIANASMFGYNFTIAPNAELTDGLLDLVLIKKVKRYRYYLNAWRFLDSSILNAPFVQTLKGKEIVIKSEELTDFQIDGEGKGTTQSLNVQIHPSSIRILKPKQKRLV